MGEVFWEDEALYVTISWLYAINDCRARLTTFLLSEETRERLRQELHADTF